MQYVRLLLGLHKHRVCKAVSLLAHILQGSLPLSHTLYGAVYHLRTLDTNSTGYLSNLNTLLSGSPLISTHSKGQSTFTHSTVRNKACSHSWRQFFSLNNLTTCHVSLTNTFIIFSLTLSLIFLRLCFFLLFLHPSPPSVRNCFFICRFALVVFPKSYEPADIVGLKKKKKTKKTWWRGGTSMLPTDLSFE